MRILRTAFLLAIVGASLALIAVEGFLRLSGIAPVDQLRRRPSYIQAGHHLYGFALVPGIQFTYKTRFVDFSNPVRINSKGLRDDEYPYHKAEGIYRILILGDSFSANFEVPLEATWHQVLERALNTADGLSQIEVISASTPGWATDQQLLYYVNEGYRYEPDLVLLQFYVNDLRDNDVDFERRMNGALQFEKPYFVLEDRKLRLVNFPFTGEPLRFDWRPGRSLLSRVNNHLRRNLHTFRLLHNVRGRMRPADPFCYRLASGVPLDLLFFSPNYPPEHRRAWEVTTGIIARLHEEVSKQGATFAVVYFPERRQVIPEDWRDALRCWPKAAELEWDLDRPNRRLGGYLKTLGIPYLDLTLHLREFAAQGEDNLYFPRDWHLRPVGHRLTADLLQAWLTNRHLVPVPQGGK